MLMFQTRSRPNKKKNKKYELMLMRRETASVQFHTQVSWSISSNFGENSVFKCASQTEIAKNSLKPSILLVQGRLRLSMLVFPERSSAVLVMITSKSVSICNRSRARLVDSSRNRTFSRFVAMPKSPPPNLVQVKDINKCNTV